MGFGGFGAPGMGFGAAAQGSNYNHVNQSATQGLNGTTEQPEIPGEDPPLPPGDDINASQNSENNEVSIGNSNASKTAGPNGAIQPLMGSTFQPWGGASGTNISFAGGIIPGSNVPPGFNSMPSQVLNQGGVGGLSKKALKKKRKKEREEAQAAALQAKTYAQAAAPTPHNIPPPPGPPPIPTAGSASNTNTPSSNAMNVENWPDSLR